MDTQQFSFGELITSLYSSFLERYGDAALASLATAEAINTLLADRDGRLPSSVAA
jgi:hypothetical protein